VHHLAALSTGELVENPKALDRYRRRLARLGRELSRAQAGSKRRRCTRAKLARCHRRVANLRRDALHKLTTSLASSYGTVVVEDLNVEGMTAAPKPRPDAERPGTFAHNGRRTKAGLNRAVLDTSPAELRRQLGYKLDWRGGRLIVADRFFPSSKTCSSCGAVKAKLSLDERTYRCGCGLGIGRDLNAARNLAAFGRRQLDVAGSGPETENARGGGHPRPRPKPPLKREDGSGSPDRAVTASSQGEAA
jgi:putative transposase